MDRTVLRVLCFLSGGKIEASFQLNAVVDNYGTRNIKRIISEELKTMEW